MQDKRKDILVDKSWDAMQLILDKEMPQKKKRRFFFWCLFGGLLLVSSYFTYSQIYKPSKAVIASKEIVIQKSQLSDKEASLSIEAANDNQLNETIESSSITSTEIKKSNNQNLDQTELPISTKAAEPQILTTKESTATEQTKVVAINSKTATGLNSSVRPVHDIILKTNNLTTDSQKGKEIIEDKSNFEVLELKGLDAKKIQAQELAKQEIKQEKENLINNTFSKIIEEPIQKRALLNFMYLTSEENIMSLNFLREIVIKPSIVQVPDYWYGQLGSNLNWAPAVNLFGFDMNLAFGRSFKDRLDLGLVLGIGSFTYSESTNNQSDINTTGRIMISEAEASNILNSSFRNASFIDLGIHSSFRLSSRLKVNAEVGYMYLFASMFKTGNNPNNFGNPMDTASSPVEMDVEIEFEEGKTTDLEYELEQKWFPYATLGASIGFNQKLGINISYKKVFGELFESSSNPLSMNQIQVGIRYRFLDTSSKP